MTAVPAPSTFAARLAAIAQREYDDYHIYDENDPALAQRIKHYWDTLGFAFPGVGTAWSAVFVSYCVKVAGATSAEFEFAAAHSIFVHKAIQNRDNSVGVFRAYDIPEESARVGDIIQNNRGGSSHDYSFARTNTAYISHSVIVVARGADAHGKFAITVGGNESDSVRRQIVRLNDDGSVTQKPNHYYICLIKDLK